MGKRMAIPVALAFLLVSGCGRYDTPGGGKEDHILKETPSGTWTPGFSEAECRTLFEIARDTLEWCVKGSGGPFSFEKYEITPALKNDMATFVTLEVRGMLRGCIGSLAPVAPVYRSVHDNAVNAAAKDPRFRRVEPAELAGIDVHISLLSPIEPIPSIEAFKIGEHGIIIEKGPYRAVYLPEVAVEQNWTREQTLSSLSVKAGMKSDAWREGCRFKVFSSVVLSEEREI